MRARNIKPGFFSNEFVSQLSYQTRLLFIGLWCTADRNGRLEDRPPKIRIEVFPFDNVDDLTIDAMLDELASFKELDDTPQFILRYEVKMRKYIQIVNFQRHQNPHRNERKSTIPAPEMYRELLADSLIPDSLNHDSLIQEQDAFDEFWKEYPRKVAKQTAFGAWQKLKPTPKLIKEMHIALGWQKKSEQWTKDGGAFVPYPATWLNQARWTDLPPEAPHEERQWSQRELDGLAAIEKMQMAERAKQEAAKQCQQP